MPGLDGRVLGAAGRMIGLGTRLANGSGKAWFSRGDGLVRVAGPFGGNGDPDGGAALNCANSAFGDRPMSKATATRRALITSLYTLIRRVPTETFSPARAWWNQRRAWHTGAGGADGTPFVSRAAGRSQVATRNSQGAFLSSPRDFSPARPGGRRPGVESRIPRLRATTFRLSRPPRQRNGRRQEILTPDPESGFGILLYNLHARAPHGAERGGAS